MMPSRLVAKMLHYFVALAANPRGSTRTYQSNRGCQSLAQIRSEVDPGSVATRAMSVVAALGFPRGQLFTPILMGSGKNPAFASRRTPETPRPPPASATAG